MAIDKARLAQFRKEIEALQKDLSFQEYYRQIQARLVDMLAKANVDTSTKLWEIRKIVEPAFHPYFSQYVDKIFLTYNVVIDLVNDQYSDLGTDISRDFDQIRALEKIQRTRLGQYEEDEILRIAKDIRNGIRKHDDLNALAKRLSTDTGDRVKYYAKTIARTQLKGYAQVCKVEKARIAEVVWYEYVGFIRETTREFCLNLLTSGDRHYHVDIINQMDNHNLKPVLIYRGGWNCHHDWEPDPGYEETE